MTTTSASWLLRHSRRRDRILRAMEALRLLSFLGRLRVMVRRPKWLAKSTSWGSSPGCSVRVMLEEDDEDEDED